MTAPSCARFSRDDPDQTELSLLVVAAVTVHNRQVSSREQQSFADIVQQVKEEPAKPRRSTARPGLTRSGTFVSTDGGEYTYGAEISADEAAALADEGARVVYDSCGCGQDHADAPLRWFASGDPVLAGRVPVLHPERHGLAQFHSWQASGGDALVHAAGDVEWGTAMAPAG